MRGGDWGCGDGSDGLILLVFPFFSHSLRFLLLFFVIMKTVEFYDEVCPAIGYT